MLTLIFSNSTVDCVSNFVNSECNDVITNDLCGSECTVIERGARKERICMLALRDDPMRYPMCTFLCYKIKKPSNKVQMKVKFNNENRVFFVQRPFLNFSASPFYPLPFFPLVVFLAYHISLKLISFLICKSYYVKSRIKIFTEIYRQIFNSFYPNVIARNIFFIRLVYKAIKKFYLHRAIPKLAHLT